MGQDSFHSTEVRPLIRVVSSFCSTEISVHPCQAVRSAAAEVLVQQLLASQQQHEKHGSTATPAAPQDADEEGEAGAAAPGAANRQQKLQQALKGCSPLMVGACKAVYRHSSLLQKAHVMS